MPSREQFHLGGGCVGGLTTFRERWRKRRRACNLVANWDNAFQKTHLVYQIHVPRPTLLSGCKLSHALVFSHLQLRPPRAPVLEDWAAHTEMIASHSRHLLLHCGATLCIGCKAKVMVFLFYQAIGILSSRQVFPMPALNRCMTRRRGLWGYLVPPSKKPASPGKVLCT
jgi:hypothetical protein